MTFVALKCALIPLFSLLPKAHGSPGAPSAVSAVLSGLYIKSAVYLFIRFIPLFELIDNSVFFLILGITSGIVGFTYALSQTDLKRILAYHTISQVGLIMAALNLGGDYSFVGGLYHAINHTMFKSALFLSAGAIITVYGIRDVTKIRGVFKHAPLLGIATIMAIFGITGAPFFNGSISKYFIVSGTTFLMNSIFIFMSLGTIISFIKFSTMLFDDSKTKRGNENVPKIKMCKQAAIFILSFMCLLGGIFGQQAISFLFNYDVSIDLMGYIEKAVIYFVSVIMGYLIYKYFVKTSVYFKRLRELEMGFRGICASLAVFFAIILLITGFT
jgi:multicomponent Na+:H+ antiporter subunit D